MAIPTVYRSTDPGAPVLSTAATDAAITVLRACLVTGYGSKSPAGWAEPFSATNKAVFRASVGGTGAFFRVQALGGARLPFSLTGYSSMTGVDTGIDATLGAWGLGSPSTDSGNPAHAWTVVATPTAFWFSAEHAGASMLCGAGDAISTSLGDAYRYFVAGGGASTYLWPCPWLFNGGNGGDNGQSGGWGASASLNSGLSFGRDFTGLGSGIGAGILKPWFYASNDEAYVGGTQYPGLPAINAAMAALMPAYAVHGPLGGNAIIRGRLPGVYVPLCNLSARAVGDVNVATAGAGSSTIVLKHVQNRASALLVETSLDWG